MTFRLKHAMLAALFAGMLAVFFVNAFAINHYPPTWTMPDGRSGFYDPNGIRHCMGARALSLLADAASASRWRRCAALLTQGGVLDAFHWRYWALFAASAVTLTAALGFALSVRFDRPAHRVLRGRRLHTGQAARQAFTQAAKPEIAQSGAGLALLPGLTISRERETRHWLIWGSVGSGKTQTMLHLILAALARGDGVLVLDVKGDMTETLPGTPQLIAPQDQRSLIWDVARDCRTKQDARELANRLIPDSHDPMWSDAAREVLVVCLSALQATQPGQWTWRDLHALSTANGETLLALARRHHLDAVRLLENPDSRTTQSVLSTFQTHMHVVAALADAWCGDANKKFSVTEWVHNPKSFQPVILQHDQRYPALSNIWIGGILALLASAVGSPSLKESRLRRIWIFADEFPQLPRLNNFSTFLDLGRSKGVITVIGAQDLAQLRATYGKDRADAWMSIIGTKIITRINAGLGPREASELVGDQEIEREERSQTNTGGTWTTTTSRRREARRVITADEIATRLGPDKGGIDVLLLGLGNDVLKLTVPYITLPPLRPHHIPATWLSAAPTAVLVSEPVPTQRSAALLSKDAAQRIRELGD
jgi:Type IV secretion-system coupling protein DNA-binding domain